jgi:phosphatidylserine/phosphatidylglycerophosphate/cardiolipin synthase-like enzyme
LSPELYLRRPPAKNADWRLDRILKRKAEQGVKICVAVYQEVCIDYRLCDKLNLSALRHPKVDPLMTMNSAHTKVRGPVTDHTHTPDRALIFRELSKPCIPTLHVCATQTILGVKVGIYFSA